MSDACKNLLIAFCLIITTCLLTRFVQEEYFRPKQSERIITNVREQLNEFESSLISMQTDRLEHELKMDQFRVSADARKRDEMWTKINNLIKHLNITVQPLKLKDKM